jgi:RNA-dependent RNA polymerase
MNEKENSIKEENEDDKNKNILEGVEDEKDIEINEEKKNLINYNIKTFNLNSYPAFGTFYQSKNNNKYFIDFSKFHDKIKKISNNCYLLYNKTNPTYFLIIIKDDYEISLKFSVNISSIEKIIYGNKIKNDDDNYYYQTLYFYLKYAPKIYITKSEKKEENQNIFVGKNIYEKSILKFLKSEFYFNNFKMKLNQFSYSNHYHHNNEKKIIKKNRENNNISFKSYETLDFIEEDFSKIFIDSLLSKSNEFLNFYLLNLILKIKIKFKYENECDNFLKNDFNLKNLISYEEKFTILIPEMNNRIITYLKNAQLSFFQVLYSLHFSLQYSILSLITNKRINLFNTNLIYLLNYCSNFDCITQEKVSKILDEINNDSTIKLKDKFFEYLQNKIEYDLNTIINTELIKIEESLNYTKTIEITPSIILYNPPKLERTNQFIRLFKEIPDHFLKIKFVTEDKNLFYFASDTSNRFISFLNSLMINGLYVGSYYFEFLTSSNNQSKEASGWYMNIEESGFKNIIEVNTKFGDFTNEKNIYKNAFRRGQIASTSTSIMILKKENLILINDILSEDNKYNYTDGIGQISHSLANKINLKMKKNNYFECSAYQIRIEGIKGIVSINPNLKGDCICYRPSMKKYHSELMELGVIKTSKFSQGYLNSQIIILLSTLGIDKNIFIELMENTIKNYDNLINAIKNNNNNNQNLYNLFKENEECIDEIFENIYYLSPLYYMYQNTSKFLKEPLLIQMIFNAITSKIKKLKYERKILDKDSVYLIGVIDETRTLKHDEVYIHIQKPNKYNTEIEEDKIIEGEIIITKNPCLHPGDIRIVKAINNDEINSKLKHMKNVIVFSSQIGKRPIPNMISGGDLDGDCFYVSWNKKLLDNIKIRNYEPLEDPKNYLNLTNNKSFSNSNIMDYIIEAKIKSTKNFTIPKISSLHIAIADNDIEKYAFNEQCIKLSELFSIAIDSEKTGVFVESNEINKFNLKQFPDFLNFNSENQYKSPGILGIIYRMLDFEKYKKLYEEIIYDISVQCIYEIDLNLITNNSINYVKKCYEIYKDYCKDIKIIIEKFEFKNECELFTNENIYILKKPKFNKSDDRQFRDLSNLQKKYLKLLNNIYKEINEDIASAVYLVTYYYKNNNQKLPQNIKNQMDDIYKNEDNNHNKILSFPWIIKDIRDKLKIISNKNKHQKKIYYKNNYENRNNKYNNYLNNSFDDK